MSGVVYVLSTDDLQGIVKVGYTKHNPEVRASQITTQHHEYFSTRRPFKVEFYAQVSSIAAEREAHKILAHHRLPSGKRNELFQVSVSEASRVVRQVASKHKPKYRLDSNGQWVISDNEVLKPLIPYEEKYELAKREIIAREINPVVTDVCKRCGCSPRTASKILSGLRDDNVITQDSRRRYRLNPT